MHLSAQSKQGVFKLAQTQGQDVDTKRSVGRQPRPGFVKGFSQVLFVQRDEAANTRMLSGYQCPRVLAW